MLAFVPGALMLIGLLATIPAFVFFLGSGTNRLFKLSWRLEQKLIDFKVPLIVGHIAGWLCILAGLTLERSWLVLAFLAITGVANTVSLIEQSETAQRDLDVRQANVFEEGK